MSSQLSFFNLVGYLVPGIIFFVLFPQHLLHQFEPVQAVITNFNDLLKNSDSFASGIAFLTALSLPAFAIVFPIGIFISEIYMWIIRKLYLFQWNCNQFDENSLYAQLEKKGAETVLIENWVVREALVLNQVGKWDLYGFAGRTRLLGASGFTLILDGIVYFFLAFFDHHYWFWFLSFFAFGYFMMSLAISLHKVYGDFTDINAFVFYRLLKTTTESDKSSESHK
jgi:hypothetical protein